MTCLDDRLQGATKIVVCALLSTLVFSLVPFIAHIFGISNGFHVIMLCWLTALAPFGVLRPRVREAHNPTLLNLLAIGCAIRFMVFFGNPQPRVGDSFTHFEMAKSFLTKRWYSTMVIDNYWTEYLSLPFPGFYRPPLQDLLHSIAMVMNSQTYVAAASMSMVFGILVIIAIWAVARENFGDRAAFFASSLACVNYFMIERSLELEPRLMVSFFILVFILFLDRGRDYWVYTSLAAAFAWLIHYSSVWFILAALIVCGYKKRDRVVNRYVLFSVILFLMLISPWLARNMILFGNPVFTTARYVPFMTGWEEYFLLEPPTPSSYILDMGGGWMGMTKALGVRAVNLVTTYVPAPNRIFTHGLTWTLSSSIINLVGPVAFLMAMSFIITRRKGLATNPLFGVIIFCSLVGPMFTGYAKSDGVSVDFLSPLTPIYLIFCGAYLDQKDHKKLFALVVVSLLIQTFWLSDARFKDIFDPSDFDIILDAVPKDAAMMSFDMYMIRHYTGRYGAVTPNADFDQIIQTMDKLDISYYVLFKNDQVKRDIDAQRLSDVADLVGEDSGIKVYKLREDRSLKK